MCTLLGLGSTAGGCAAADDGRGGIAIAVISETLGHDSESVTKTYLESFENEVLDRADEVLL
ncbi:MAG: hypothetical protein AAFV25_01995 [Bacteroidota bacterium]